MNDPSESMRGAATSGEHINGHAAHMDLAGNVHSVGPRETFQRRRRPVVDPFRTEPQLRSQELDTENGGPNEFMTVFSHELRNSLGAIGSAVRILRIDTSASPAMVRARVLIERQVGHMTRLVEDLLDVSRARNGHLCLRRERIDLCALVAQAVESVEFIMQQYNHRMTTSFPNAPVWLQADPTRMEQVFVNLLLNAAKYTEVGGHVGLSVERGEGEAIVRICDTGIGIAPDLLPQVFDLFAQANPSSPRADAGLGIGLALVRSLVECHGGNITAASAGLRQGSEFTVRLPMSGE
jgi:signal transduction histidine kinase